MTDDQLLAWAADEFGPENLYADGERDRDQAIAWARQRYTQHLIDDDPYRDVSDLLRPLDQEPQDPWDGWWAPGFPTEMDEMNAREADDYQDEGRDFETELPEPEGDFDYGDE